MNLQRGSEISHSLYHHLVSLDRQFPANVRRNYIISTRLGLNNGTFCN